MYKIIKIEPSIKKSKRFRVYLNNGDHYDFGLEKGSTYLDHHDALKRYNYFKTHYANEYEKHLIDNLIPSPSLFSMVLLWGKYTSIEKNVKILNKLWSKYYKK